VPNSLLSIDNLPISAPSYALDGSNGANRARGGGVRQIAADTDVDAVRLWLAEYAGSPHTLRSYRKESVRLLLWATQGLGKPLSSLNREDLLAYEAFLAHPSAEWIDPALPRRGGGRRLVDGPLSPRSVRQAMGILSGLFGYLVTAGYLAGNPLALRRRRGESKGARRAAVERYLDHALWQSVLDFIETLPQETRRDRQHYERVRWLFRLLYGAALRVSETAQAQSSDLAQRRGKWWLHVVGKGGAEAVSRLAVRPGRTGKRASRPIGHRTYRPISHTDGDLSRGEGSVSARGDRRRIHRSGWGGDATPGIHSLASAHRGLAPGRRRQRHPLYPEEPATRVHRDHRDLSACRG